MQFYSRQHTDMDEPDLVTISERCIDLCDHSPVLSAPLITCSALDIPLEGRPPSGLVEDIACSSRTFCSGGIHNILFFSMITSGVGYMWNVRGPR